MQLISLENVSLAYGLHPLLEKVNFQVNSGERVCLVGRNGTGKSTLLRVISKEIEPDDGEVWRKDALRISHLEQDVPADAAISVYDMVASGLGELGSLLSRYHHAASSATHSDEKLLQELARLQQEIEVRDGWNLNQKIDTVISRLDLPTDKLLRECSGGVRRRVLLARALVSDPELLLLDEPTNHMDIAAITWLEEFLQGFQGGLIFITHDRTFLKHLATRIVELDRGVLTSFNGDYDYYLRKKEEMLQAEERSAAKFDKKLAEEEAWIRQGIKARRTRNEGRVRALEQMRRQRAERIARQGQVSLDVNDSDKSGKRVVDLHHVSISFGDQPIIQDLSTRIMRGDRIGIIGPNGSGKSTLLRILLGELKPDSGQVIMGARLQTAYFDQQREQLDPEKTVRENISEGSDFIDVRGKSRHVISYLRDFLFPPQRIDTPVKVLSGGERNRLLLARIFTRPANLLVLDEPTNDLDVDTLELLEELLAEYDGTLILVSHDRTFLDNVVSSTLVFEGNGQVREYVGGYEDWVRQRRISDPFTDIFRNKGKPETEKAVKEKPREKEKLKLSYKEKRELEALPGRIESLEQEQTELESRIGDPAFYQQDKDTITTTLSRLQQVQQELHDAFERWEQLDNFEA